MHPFIWLPCISYPRPQTPQRQTITKSWNTPADCSSWEWKLDAREFHGNKLNLAFTKVRNIQGRYVIIAILINKHWIAKIFIWYLVMRSDIQKQRRHTRQQIPPMQKSQLYLVSLNHLWTSRVWETKQTKDRLETVILIKLSPTCPLHDFTTIYCS